MSLGDIQDALSDIVRKADERDKLALYDSFEALKRTRPTDFTIQSKNPIIRHVMWEVGSLPIKK